MVDSITQWELFKPLAAMPRWYVLSIVFYFGAMVGSFLNVCIHRMPRNHSVVKPRSKCYSCGHVVEWYDNIPLFSFLLLRGKCRHCGAKFSIRYWIVELLTALMFLVVWTHFAPAEAFAYSIFISGLIVATFIDFEHMIIPDEITIGGVFVGIALSGLIPSLQSENRHFMAALKSLGGAAAGYFTLYAVVEFGKRVFGVKKLQLNQEETVLMTCEGIKIGSEGDMDRWEDLFSRDSDVLRFEASNVLIQGELKFEKAQVVAGVETVKINDEEYKLVELPEIRASAREFLIPREAMGFGDVKFIAALGAFLGPMAVFFIILVSSFTGSIVGLTTMLIGKREWGMKLPYGPYLAFAALIWVFFGNACIECYLQLTGRY